MGEPLLQDAREETLVTERADGTGTCRRVGDKNGAAESDSPAAACLPVSSRGSSNLRPYNHEWGELADEQ